MKTKRLIMSFATLLLTTLLIQAQNISDTNKINSSIDEYIKSVINDFQIPGLALAVVKDNNIYFEKAYGLKNLNTKDSLSVKSVFHMSSVSKPFVVTAIIQLVEKGKMKLDDPLVKYLPYFKLDDPYYKEITIKQILTHTSGMPDVQDYEWNKPQFDDGAAERYVRSLANEKMIAKPGEKFRYSNMAFDVLADVISKVSSMTFENYIKEKILNPLNMKESDFLRERIKPDLRTSGHIFNLQPRVSEIYPYNRIHAPSSCLESNVTEMCNWAIANMNKGFLNGKRILDESSYKLLFEPQFKASDERFFNENADQFIGLSWFIKQYRGFKTIFHSGGDLGYRSEIIMIPEKSLAVIVASNYSSTPINGLAFGLIDIVLGYAPQYSKIPISFVMGKIIIMEGVENAIAFYKENKNNSTDKYFWGEDQLNTLGYQLMNNNRLDDALEIFKLNVEIFPQGFNTYDSLGEAYMRAGKKELAIKNYEKSLQINPKNENAVEMLKQLQNSN